MRLIDADALSSAIANHKCIDSFRVYDFNRAFTFEATKHDMYKKVITAPTIDAEPVRHGRWIDCGDYITTAYGSLELKVCSNCNAEVTLDGYDYYCPSCGAKMCEEE